MLRHHKEAHERLQAQLDVRTHKARPRIDESHKKRFLNAEYRLKKAEEKLGKGRGGHNRIPLVIDGLKFPGFREACKHFHVTGNTIYIWLSEGRAKRG